MGTDNELVRRVAPPILAGLGAAATGGPLAGAAAAIAEIAIDIVQARRGDIDRVLANSGITAEQLIDAVRETPRLLDLVRAVSAGAGSTDLRSRRNALGLALVRGTLAADTTVIDDEIRLSDALSVVGVPEIRVLEILERRDQMNLGGERRAIVTRIDILEESPGLAEAIDPVLARLSGAGLIGDAGDPQAAAQIRRDSPPPALHHVFVSEFGNRLLAYLREGAGELSVVQRD